MIDLASLFGPRSGGLVRSDADRGLALDASGARLVVNVGDRAQEFDLRDGARVQEYDLSHGPFDPSHGWCVSMGYSRDAQTLWVAHAYKLMRQRASFVRVFDRASGHCLSEPAVTPNMEFASINASGEFLLTGESGDMRVNRVADGVELSRCDGIGFCGVAWDATTDNVVALDVGVVYRLDPRTLHDTGVYDLPVDPYRDFPAGRLRVRVPQRSIEDLESFQAELSMECLDLPWGGRLWCEPTDLDQRIVWLAEDGESAVVCDGRQIEFRSASGEPQTLVTLSSATQRAEVAVSDDGTTIAWREGAEVHWVKREPND